MYWISARGWHGILSLVIGLLVPLSTWLASMCRAGEFNPTHNIHDQIEGWGELPGTDGQLYSMSDFSQYDVLVVVFTCNSCPYAVDYEDRINTLAKKFQDKKLKAALVAINANKIEADQMPAMKERAGEKSFCFPYLHDESQQVPKKFGAVRTPEFYVLNKERRIVYMGAMDDNTNEAAVAHKYVEAAVEEALAGREVTKAETAPVGCLIRIERTRRK
jgi:peroxiredoxin